MKLQVAVKALVQNADGLLLLLQRSQPLLDGGGIRWDIPGGRIESTERLHEALAREVREETSLDILDDAKLLTAQDVILPEHDIHVVRLTYLAHANGKLSLGDEHGEFRWTTPDEALTMNIDDFLRQSITTLIG